LQARETYTGNTEIADAQGRQFAFAVLSTLEGMLPAKTQLEYSGVVESGAPLATWKRAAHQPSTQLVAQQIKVQMPLKDLESVEEIRHALSPCEDRMLRERMTRKMRVRKTVGEGRSTPLPLWIWKIGEAVFVAQREEAYSVFQMELRRRFPDKTIIVLNLTNGSCGYLPPDALYDKDIYQVWQTPYARGCAEILLESVTRVLTENRVSKLP
jgi:hypothetical protein